MPTITYTAKYKKNTGLMISPSELLALYFYGINVQSDEGIEFDLETVRYYILTAQREVENYLDIKLNPQLINETLSYYSTDYYGRFPFFQTKYPVAEVYSLIGLLARAEQIIYPKEWLKVHIDPDGMHPKRFSLVPTGSGAGVSGNADVIITGILRDIGLRSYGNIPDYFNVQYKTGFEYNQLPEDILNVVGKLASIGVFNIAGDLVIGAGLASTSLSIDGLSQSLNTTQSAENSAFSARIRQYTKEIKDTMSRVKLKYRGYNFTSL